MKKIVIFLFTLCTMMMGVSNVFAKNVKTIEYKTESIKYFDTAKRQVFYTDENYKYYFKANIGDYINVIYDDSTSETIIKAFEAGNVTLNDLTTHEIEFRKIEKALEFNPHTEVGGDTIDKIYKDDSYVYFNHFSSGFTDDDAFEILKDDLNSKRLSISDLDNIGYTYLKAPKKNVDLMDSYIEYLKATNAYKNLQFDHFDNSIYYVSPNSFMIGPCEFIFEDDYILYKYDGVLDEEYLGNQIAGESLIIEMLKKLIKENNYKEEDLMFYDDEITTSYEKNGYEYKINEETGAIIEFKINLNKITLPIDEDLKVFTNFVEILEKNLPDLLLSIGCTDDYCVQYGYEEAGDNSRLYSGIFELHYKDGKINMVSSFGDEDNNLEFHEDLLNKVHEAMIKTYIEYHGINNELLNNYKLSKLSDLTLKDNGIEYKKNVSGEIVEYSFKMNILDKITIPKVTYICKEVDGKYYDPKGNEVDKKTYENVCGIEENPHTGYAISILSLLGLGCLGVYIKKHSKKKIKYNI